MGVDIDDTTGEVKYEVSLDVDSIGDSALEDISNAVVAELDSTLSEPTVLEGISNEIQDQSAGSDIAEELSTADVFDSSLGETSLTATGESTEIATTGTLDTNIDTSSLTATQKEELKEVMEDSIADSLKQEGVLSEDSTVTVTNINDAGQVEYEIDTSVGPEVKEQPKTGATTLENVSNEIISQIDSTLSDPSTLEDMSNQIKAESADSSVAKELSTVDVLDFVQGETHLAAAGTATGPGPCNLCIAGEIGLEKEILFNGAQTSCQEVYNFLATQAEDGSDSCIAGKKALRNECCMKKCDICSGGGLPDWYSMVSVNG